MGEEGRKIPRAWQPVDPGGFLAVPPSRKAGDGHRGGGKRKTRQLGGAALHPFSLRDGCGRCKDGVSRGETVSIQYPNQRMAGIEKGTFASDCGAPRISVTIKTSFHQRVGFVGVGSGGMGGRRTHK